MIDGRERILGRLERVADVRLKDMAHALLLRSPTARGTIRRLDAEVARSMPGVIAVVTADELRTEGLDAIRFGTIVADQPILAVDRVRYAGEPVAVVVASSLAAARRAVACIELDIDPEPPVADALAALTADAPLVADGRTHNELTRWGYERGDLDAARAAASHHFHGRWTSPVAQVVSLEPHAVTAHWRAPDSLELWTTSQSPSRVAQELARIFELPADHVRLHVPPVGGAFGGKNHAKLEPLVALAARTACRPVRFVNSRAEEFVTITKHAVSVEIDSGIDDDGRIRYRVARVVADGGAYANSSPVIPKAAGSAVLGPYRIDAAGVDAVVAYTNNPPAGSFRGLGVSQAAWAGEQQLDEMAAAVGLAPMEMRRRNLVRDGDRLPNGDLARDPHWLACSEAAVELLEQPAAEAASTAHAGRTRRGRGMATVMKATMSPFRTEVLLSVHADGHAEVRASAVDMGQGARTVLARLAAEALGLSIDAVTVVDPDTALTPFDATSSSSRTTYQHARAIGAAAERLRDEIEELATEVSRGQPLLAYAGGRVTAPDGSFDRSLGELLRAGGRGELVAKGAFVNEPEHDPRSGAPELTSHWHQGAVAVEVSVDIETGAVRVVRVGGAAWAGHIVSVDGARLQNEGNVIFGLGPALFEEVALVDGVPASTSLRDYRIPSLRDLPHELRTVALEAAAADHHPEGLGESLIPAVAPAIANAVADAVGVRIRDLPLHPERVLAAIDAASVGP